MFVYIHACAACIYINIYIYMCVWLYIYISVLGYEGFPHGYTNINESTNIGSKPSLSICMSTTRPRRPVQRCRTLHPMKIVRRKAAFSTSIASNNNYQAKIQVFESKCLLHNIGTSVIGWNTYMFKI